VPRSSQRFAIPAGAKKLAGRDFLSVDDFTAREIQAVFALAADVKKHPSRYRRALQGKMLALLFEKRAAADFVEVAPADHGRIETRRIWCSTALNAYLDFPHVGQVFLIERESIEKKTGECSREIALGITSRTPHEATPQRVLAVNRGHWSIESVHYLIDWNYDEDRSRIRTGSGPENITRLRRFAVGILKSFQKPAQSIAEMMRSLCFRTRLVFDYLRMTKNSVTGSPRP